LLFVLDDAGGRCVLKVLNVTVKAAHQQIKIAVSGPVHEMNPGAITGINGQTVLCLQCIISGGKGWFRVCTDVLVEIDPAIITTDDQVFQTIRVKIINNWINAVFVELSRTGNDDRIITKDRCGICSLIYIDPDITGVG
jgi:hypothetical protein